MTTRGSFDRSYVADISGSSILALPTTTLSLMCSIFNYWSLQNTHTIQALIITILVFLVNLLLIYPVIEYLIAISKYGIS